MNLIKNLTLAKLAAILAMATGLAGTTLAQTAPAGKTAAPPAAPATAADMTDGEVKKVDKSTKKITIKHGEIKNLDMPGMTMVFQVKDPAMLDMVKAGDKVKFKVEKADGTIVVTEMQVAK
nr:copper-binding protein [uncultured Roseateles sp.]